MKKIIDKEKKSNSLSEKIDSENFTFTVSECDDTNHGAAKSNDEIIEGKEKDRINEAEPSLHSVFLDKDIAGQVLCIMVTTDDPNKLVDPKKIQELIQTELIDSYEDLQNAVPNEPMNFLYCSDLLHTIKKEDYYESIHRKSTYNYLSAKAPEYFGYLDDAFVKKELLDEIARNNEIAENKIRWQKKQAEEFWEFVKAGKNILPANVKPMDITDKRENIIRFSPKKMVPNIKKSRQDVKCTDIWSSCHESKVGPSRESDVTSTINEKIIHDDFNKFSGEFHQFPNAQPISITINAATIDFINRIDWESYMAKLHDDHFQKVKSLISPSSNDIIIKNIEEDEACAPSEEEKAYQIFASIKRNLGDISEIRADKNSLEHATRVSLYGLSKIFLKNESQIEGVLLIPDIVESSIEAGVRTFSNYETQEDVDACNDRRILLPQFSEMSFGEYTESKHYTENILGENFAQTYFTSGRAIDEIDENYQRNQIDLCNKDINLCPNTQLSKEEKDFEIDFSNKDNINVYFNIPMSLMDENFDQENVRLFLNEFSSTVIQELEKNKYSASSFAQSKFIANADENGSKSTSAIQKKESDVFILKNRTIHKERQSPVTDHDASESKASLLPYKKQENGVNFIFQEPIVRKGISSNRNASKTKSLKNPKRAFNALNFKQERKLHNSYRRGGKDYKKDDGLPWKETGLFEMRNDRGSHRIQQSKYSSRKNTGIEIIEGEYPTNNKYHVLSLIEAEKWPKYTSENRAEQKLDATIYQDDDFETEDPKLLFNAQFDSDKLDLKDFRPHASKYLYVQQNGKEIMNIASENAKKIEQQFKTNKIRPVCTNIDEIIITDEVENEIKIIEEKDAQA